MSPQKMIDVIQAYNDGKQIEYKQKQEQIWNKTDCLAWNFVCFDYRIAPKQTKDYYKYLIKNLSKNRFYESYGFFKNIEDAVEEYQGCDITVIKRIDYSKITIEE